MYEKPQGLTSQEVQERIEKGLVNNSQEKEHSFLNIILTNVLSAYNYIFFFLIGFLLFFYFSTGDNRLLLDSYGICSLLVVNTSISIFEEIRARKALQKVSLLLHKTVNVIRDGKKVEIKPEELVIDDVIYVENGDQIMADGEVIYSTRLEIDESLLTGESEPIIKDQGEEILSGSFVASGDGYFRVTKFGADSFAGKITKVAKGAKFTRTPLQNKVINLIKILFALAFTLILFIVIKNFPNSVFKVDVIREYVTIIIGTIPQGLIFLSTITYALGIYRISKIGAIIQKTSAIEAFSGVDIVCTDKTGTLTQNKLSVTKVSYLDENSKDIIDKLFGTFSNYISYKNSTSETLKDFPKHENIEVVDELPFNSKFKLSALKVKIGNETKVLILGGFDILSSKTDSDFKGIDNEEIKVYRNLLFGEIADENFDFQNIREGKDYKINPLAVVSISDTVRKDSMEVVKLFHDKNIDVKILSGDAAFAVQAIAKNIGWEIDDSDLVTGDELNSLNDEEFKKVIYSKKIFARLKPEHKQKIIQTFQDDKHFVTMIGDGVNDLPAIKKANLGIAMQEGSQITKDVADIVLIENKFTLLPEIFNEGNKIVNSIRYAGRLFLTKNTFTILMSFLTIFTSLPFVLSPRNISFVNIFAITLPSFFLSLYNDDIIGSKSFIKDIFGAIIIPAFTFLGGSYTSFALATNFFPEISKEQHAMIAVTTLAFLAIFNFIAIILVSKISKANKSYLFAASIVFFLFFIIFMYIDLSHTPLFWIQDLYEVIPLEANYWLLIIPIVISSAVIISLSHILKEKLFKKYNLN